MTRSKIYILCLVFILLLATSVNSGYTSVVWTPSNAGLTYNNFLAVGDGNFVAQDVNGLWVVPKNIHIQVKQPVMGTLFVDSQTNKVYSLTSNAKAFYITQYIITDGSTISQKLTGNLPNLELLVACTKYNPNTKTVLIQTRTTIMEISLSGSIISSVGLPSYSSSSSCAIDTHRQLFYVHTGYSLVVFSIATSLLNSPLQTIATVPLSTPICVSDNTLGDVYCGDSSSSNIIHVFSANSSVINNITLPIEANLEGIAVDGGQLYAFYGTSTPMMYIPVMSDFSANGTTFSFSSIKNDLTFTGIGEIDNAIYMIGKQTGALYQISLPSNTTSSPTPGSSSTTGTISDGALSGIIIGCIIGAAIVVVVASVLCVYVFTLRPRPYAEVNV